MDTQALLVIGDLFFTARIRDTLKHVGIASLSARTEEELGDRLDVGGLQLGIVDLSIGSIDPLIAVTRLKKAGLPVLTFAGHTAAAAMEAARAAGSDLVVTNGQISAQLPALVRELGVVVPDAK